MPSLVANLYHGYGPTSGGGSPPNTPTLSQPANNGDGTGATASIAGSSAGSTNQIYVAPWATAGNNLSWTLKATRTGDGAAAISLANGLYVARCVSTLAGLPAAPGNEPVFETTGGASYQSVHKALAEKVAATIRAMLGTSIVGPASDSVRVRKTAYLQDFSGVVPLPADKNYLLPAIIVCYFDQIEQNPLDGTNARDAIGYPITIVFSQQTQSQNTSSESLDDRFLRWQEAIDRTFQHLRGSQFGGFLTVTASGIDYTFHNCVYKGGLIFDPDRGLKKLDVGWMKYSFVLWRGRLGT